MSAPSAAAHFEELSAQLETAPVLLPAGTRFEGVLAEVREWLDNQSDIPFYRLRLVPRRPHAAVGALATRTD